MDIYHSSQRAQDSFPGRYDRLKNARKFNSFFIKFRGALALYKNSNIFVLVHHSRKIAKLEIEMMDLLRIWIHITLHFSLYLQGNEVLEKKIDFYDSKKLMIPVCETAKYSPLDSYVCRRNYISSKDDFVWGRSDSKICGGKDKGIFDLILSFWDNH